MDGKLLFLVLCAVCLLAVKPQALFRLGLEIELFINSLWKSKKIQRALVKEQEEPTRLIKGNKTQENNKMTKGSAQAKIKSTTTILNHPKKCSKCPPGWGAYNKCTEHLDTKCIKCTPGKTYSSQYSKSPCLPCSQCGVGLYQSHKCTPIKDTICSECVAYLDHKNMTNRNEFLEKLMT